MTINEAIKVGENPSKATDQQLDDAWYVLQAERANIPCTTGSYVDNLTDNIERFWAHQKCVTQTI